jgi:hypothetical protein
MLRLAAEKLTPLLDEIAFLGGCAIGLLITDPSAAPVRGTIDVDVVVEVATYAEYAALEGRLREIGFRERHEDNVICRWWVDRLIIDVMPTDTSILGFGNRWYPAALRTAQWIDIGSARVRVITAPYFLATKLEAFYGRGNGDYLGSRDVEDIIALVDGRPELLEDIRMADPELGGYLCDEFRELLHDRDFIEAIAGHLLPDDASQQRRELVVRRLRDIAGTARSVGNAQDHRTEERR